LISGRSVIPGATTFKQTFTYAFSYEDFDLAWNKTLQKGKIYSLYYTNALGSA